MDQGVNQGEDMEDKWRTIGKSLGTTYIYLHNK